MDDKRYYWLKLKRDFFKRHDIRIVEGMPNGKEYILFYLKLLVESVDHEGGLRFNDTIPYSDEMLAVITNTNIDIVRSALTVFTQFGMIEVLDDGTIYMSEVQKMIGTAASSDNAIRQQRFRDKKKEEQFAELPSVTNSNASVTQSVTKRNASVTPDVTQAVTNSNESKSIEKELELELEKESELDIKESKPKKTRFSPPTIEEVQAYCLERGNNVDPERFIDYYASQKWKKANGRPLEDWKAAVRTWEKNSYSKPQPKPNSYRSGGNEFTALLENMEDE